MKPTMTNNPLHGVTMIKGSALQITKRVSDKELLGAYPELFDRITPTIVELHPQHHLEGWDNIIPSNIIFRHKDSVYSPLILMGHNHLIDIEKAAITFGDANSCVFDDSNAFDYLHEASKYNEIGYTIFVLFKSGRFYRVHFISNGAPLYVPI